MNKEVPPVAALYQLIVDPAVAVADNVTVPLPHLDAGELVRMLGMVLIVAVTAVLAEIQLLLDFAST